MRRGRTGRCRRWHDHNFSDPCESSDVGAMAFHAGRDTGMAHLRAGEFRPIRDRCYRDARARAHVADLTGLRGRHVIGWQSNNLEVCRRYRERIRVSAMALRAIGGLARCIGMDINERRQHGIVAAFMAVGAGRRSQIRDMVRRLHDAVKVVEVRSVTAQAIPTRGMCRVLDHKGPRRRAGTGLEAGVMRTADKGDWADGVLAHRHPRIATLVTALAIGGDARMNLSGRWRRRHKERAWQRLVAIRGGQAGRHGGLMATRAITGHGDMRG